jgi:hypothetical protein
MVQLGFTPGSANPLPLLSQKITPPANLAITTAIPSILQWNGTAGSTTPPNETPLRPGQTRVYRVRACAHACVCVCPYVRVCVTIITYILTNGIIFSYLEIWPRE